MRHCAAPHLTLCCRRLHAQNDLPDGVPGGAGGVGAYGFDAPAGMYADGGNGYEYEGAYYDDNGEGGDGDEEHNIWGDDGPRFQGYDSEQYANGGAYPDGDPGDGGQYRDDLYDDQRPGDWGDEPMYARDARRSPAAEYGQRPQGGRHARGSADDDVNW